MLYAYSCCHHLQGIKPGMKIRIVARDPGDGSLIRYLFGDEEVSQPNMLCWESGLSIAQLDSFALLGHCLPNNGLAITATAHSVVQ